MTINKSLISGSTEILILRLLEEKDMYGYEMIDVLRQRSKDVFELKAGTLYPLLHSLELKKIVTSYESESNGKMRKYYQITEKGKAYQEQLEQEWNTYTAAVREILDCSRDAAEGGKEEKNE